MFSFTSLTRFLESAIGGFPDLLWPRRCLMCPPGSLSIDIERALCRDCLTDLTSDTCETCPRCAARIGPFTDQSGGCASCRGSRFHFAAATRLGAYEGRLRAAILRIKHDREEPLAEELGELTARCRAEQIHTMSPQVVIPVPLYWIRRIQRGYNQAEAVARGVAKELGLPLRTGWLCRIRSTAQQRKVSVEERRTNVRDVFRVSRSARLREARILLIDDVMTTGATLDAAALALLRAGAAQVSVLVVARR